MTKQTRDKHYDKLFHMTELLGSRVISIEMRQTFGSVLSFVRAENKMQSWRDISFTRRSGHLGV